MFNLSNDTKHEAGIIVYSGNSVAVYNWASCDDNRVPMLSPFGQPIEWLQNVADDATLVHVCSADDVRDYLPGTVFMEDSELHTDMDIVYDANDDMPALFGFGPNASDYDGDKPYKGDVWRLPGGETVITIDTWN